MLRRFDNHALQFAPSLTNIAIGIGEWKNSHTPILSPWPLFSKFTELVPFFLAQLKNKQNPSLADIFPDPDLIINGGTSHSTKATLDAGTSQNPSGDKITAEIQIEKSPQTANSRFLWLLQSKQELAPN